MRPFLGPAIVLALCLACGVGCGGSEQESNKPKTAVKEAHAPESQGQEALAKEQGLELRKFDLNRDDEPDIFKFYRMVDDPKNPGNKLEQLVRKEIDINHDGKIDVVRLFNDKQEVSEERTDLDFDGRFDEVAFFKDGKLVRKEIDLNYDGTPDVYRYYTELGLQRIESDRDGNGKVDNWEYYEQGELDRIGVDTNGDGEVDQWEVKRQAEAAPTEGGEGATEGDAAAAPAAGDAGAVPAQPEASPEADEGDGES